MKILAVVERGPNNPEYATPMTFETYPQAMDWLEDNASGHSFRLWKLRDDGSLELIP